MEQVVAQNRYLFWDGWTVVNSYPFEKGMLLANGAFVKGKWHLQKRFEPSQTGWDIPDKFAV